MGVVTVYPGDVIREQAEAMVGHLMSLNPPRPWERGVPKDVYEWSAACFLEDFPMFLCLVDPTFPGVSYKRVVAVRFTPDDELMCTQIAHEFAHGLQSKYPCFCHDRHGNPLDAGQRHAAARLFEQIIYAVIHGKERAGRPTIQKPDRAAPAKQSRRSLSAVDDADRYMDSEPSHESSKLLPRRT